MGAFENSLHTLSKETIIDLYGQTLDENRSLRKQVQTLDKRSNQSAYEHSESFFTVCLDFDGTVVDRGQWPDMGPDLGSETWLREVVKRGGKIILWTMRDGMELQAAIDYMAGIRVELFGVNGNSTQNRWTASPKAHCSIVVDDRSLGIPLRIGSTGKPVVEWLEAGPMLLAAFEDWEAGR